MDYELANAMRVAAGLIGDSIERCGKRIEDAIKVRAAVEACSRGIDSDEVRKWISNVDHRARR